MWTNSINQANKMALRAWAKETGINLVQVNGQRRYGGPPPGWVGGPPPAGTEVFIGKLPQDVYENALIPLFQSVGKLYEFRLMMTFSGLNRGFAYAKYGNQRDAKEAITALHNFEVREGCAIVVCRSTEKCELSVDGLAASVSRQELEAVLWRHRGRPQCHPARQPLPETGPDRCAEVQLAPGCCHGQENAHGRERKAPRGADEGELAETRLEAEAAVLQGEATVQLGSRWQVPGGPQAGASVPRVV
ncbi:DND microRNA-mediated repression inhibitor 1 [Columba livia]|uniref:DND microRNA-mediated repression inhibitor 1 n=1 Tax=Columba livia TaxID=8932 RepID=A0A2I0LQR0_COLLI|nr:DND microRNA-mediated repression inhibitor 1 [Columba livia]